MKSRPPEARALEGDDHSVGERCETCWYWRPHVHYSFIGYCSFHDRLTFDEDSCRQWRRIKIIASDFYWCSTCKTRIMGVEAAIHLGKGHRVHRSAYIEPDVREELYSVF